ncbi:Lar family restriction alleviation protein [Pseudomonas aeruginosa]
MAEELKPCPFCGCSMRLVSNHDWHRIVGDHSAECVFLDSETMMVPGIEDQREIAIADWNARAVPAGHVVISEGLLRRVCAEPPATCCMDDEMTWRRDLDSALLELRALLDEIDRLKAENCAHKDTQKHCELLEQYLKECASALPGTYYMDPPDGGNVSIPEQIRRMAKDAARYRWLRERDLETIRQGGVFAGMTPENIVLNQEDLDAEIDAALEGETQ